MENAGRSDRNRRGQGVSSGTMTGEEGSPMAQMVRHAGRNSAQPAPTHIEIRGARVHNL